MVYVVAIITIKDQQAFVEYERQALSILKDYGGQLVSAFTPRECKNSEVHVLSFPDYSCFQKFRDHEMIKSLTALRKKAIEATQLYVSDKIIEY